MTCKISWSINSFHDPCGSCSDSIPGANFKLGNVNYSYDYNGISFSGGLTSATTVIIPTTSTPLFTIGSGWNTSKCCNGWTLYLNSGIPPNTIVTIYINMNGNVPKYCCTGTVITLKNQSYFPVAVTLGDGFYTYLMPNSDSFVCTSDPNQTANSVELGTGSKSDYESLCTNYGPSQFTKNILESFGFTSLNQCFNNVNCTQELVSENYIPLMYRLRF